MDSKAGADCGVDPSKIMSANVTFLCQKDKDGTKQKLSKF